MELYGFQEAKIDKIIRPQKPRARSDFDLWVTKDSAIWQRKHFVQIRRYQSIECDDGMAMDTSDRCWQEFVGYSFLRDYYVESSETLKQWLVGCVGFSHNETETTLEFCWIHPFWRGRGLLKEAWPSFSKRFGAFDVSQPRSNAMQGFLSSIGQ